ncbi:hypothetical protein CAEBREN_22171 [Caenorhabditis brenneri]|uniref:Uncharacterized protein n=1 Tax=Caenorhabditis brenneri TaxID=135651 RepID=G0NV50_CAEBE|nr:hypothetical protein CAEBREN_22171 [Caenorhabditis brenneri]
MKHDAMKHKVYEVIKKIESYVDEKSGGALASLVENLERMLTEKQNNVRQSSSQKEKSAKDQRVL